MGGKDLNGKRLSLSTPSWVYEGRQETKIDWKSCWEAKERHRASIFGALKALSVLLGVDASELLRGLLGCLSASTYVQPVHLQTSTNITKRQ